MNKEIAFITIKELAEIGELSPLPMVVLNTDKVLYTNPEFERLTGYDVVSLSEITIEVLFDCLQCKNVIKHLISALKDKTCNCKNEFKIKTITGKSLWVDYKYRKIMCGHTVYLLLLLFDISDKKNNEIHLSKLLKIREAMLEVTHAVMHSGNIKTFYQMILEKAISAIPSAQRGSILIAKGDLMFVAAQVGFEDESIYEFELPIKSSFLYQMTSGKMDAVVRVDDVFSLENYYRIDKAEGENAYIRSTLSAPIYINDAFYGVFSVDACAVNVFDDDDEKFMAFMSSHIEIAMANHILFEEKVFLSQYDSLTRLYNRNYFVSAFQDAKERSLRYGGHFALVVIDIDGLKEINDQYGHLIGDEVLKKFAEQVRLHLRKSDIIARYGGDEFVGLFYNVSRSELALRFNLMQNELQKELIPVDSHSIAVHFSYGISVFERDGIAFDSLFKTADTRMYLYKSKSKKRIIKR